MPLWVPPPNCHRGRCYVDDRHFCGTGIHDRGLISLSGHKQEVTAITPLYLRSGVETPLQHR